MKAKIECESRYILTINGKRLSGFEKESEWEGMIKFSGPHGVVIVDKGKTRGCVDFESILDKLNEESIESELSIVKATPDLLV